MSLAAAFLALLPLPAWARSSDHAIGAGGWRYERFGADVTILYAPPSKEPSASGTIGFFVSCTPTDRRLRLTFPTPRDAAITTSGKGLALIRSTDVKGLPGRGVLMTFTAIEDSVVSLNEQVPGQGSPISEVLRILEGAPRGITVLHTSIHGAALGQVRAMRILVHYRPGDGLIFREAGQACAHEGGQPSRNSSPK